MSEAYDSLATFFEKFTPGVYNAALGVAENVEAVEGQLGGEEKRKRKRKAPKDPNAPKKAMSSYLIFSNKFRSKVKEEHPEMTPKDVSVELGRLWREMSQEDKQVGWNFGCPPFDAFAPYYRYMLMKPTYCVRNINPLPVSTKNTRVMDLP